MSPLSEYYGGTWSRRCASAYTGPPSPPMLPRPCTSDAPACSPRRRPGCHSSCSTPLRSSRSGSPTSIPSLRLRLHLRMDVNLPTPCQRLAVSSVYCRSLQGSMTCTASSVSSTRPSTSSTRRNRSRGSLKSGRTAYPATCDSTPMILPPSRLHRIKSPHSELTPVPPRRGPIC